MLLEKFDALGVNINSSRPEPQSKLFDLMALTSKHIAALSIPILSYRRLLYKIIKIMICSRQITERSSKKSAWKFQ